MRVGETARVSDISALSNATRTLKADTARPSVESAAEQIKDLLRIAGLKKQLHDAKSDSEFWRAQAQRLTCILKDRRSWWRKLVKVKLFDGYHSLNDLSTSPKLRSVVAVAARQPITRIRIASQSRLIITSPTLPGPRRNSDTMRSAAC